MTHTLFAVLLLAILSGCTSSIPMPKGTQKGYSSARFINPKKLEGLAATDKSVNLTRMIKEAITQEFTSHGMELLDQNADLIIAHLVIIQDNVLTTSINQYFGYQDNSEILAEAHKRRVDKGQPEYLKKGALVIDLIDAKTSQLIYRDYGIRNTVANLSEEEKQVRINEIVSGILANFFK